MSFGESLTEIRKSRGISRKDLAEQLDIPYTTLRNYETGQREPGHKLLIRIAALLSVSVDELVGYQAKTEKASLYSSEASRLANAYDHELDRWGRQAVRELVETEIQRCRDETQLRESPFKEEPKVIPLYRTPAAAGYVSPIFGEDFESYELKPEDPQGAMFAVRVSGDSMEPHFPDGSIVFCSKDPIADGEIGVFCLDGDSFIKQYHYDRFMGAAYLFSLNRKRAEADKLITRSSGQTLTCLGRVMTRKRFPVPGM